MQQEKCGQALLAVKRTQSHLSVAGDAALGDVAVDEVEGDLLLGSDGSDDGVQEVATNHVDCVAVSPLRVVPLDQ